MAYDEDALVLADAAFKKTDVTLVMECQTGKQVCQQQVCDHKLHATSSTRDTVSLLLKLPVIISPVSIKDTESERASAVVLKGYKGVRPEGNI